MSLRLSQRQLVALMARSDIYGVFIRGPLHVMQDKTLSRLTASRLQRLANDMWDATHPKIEPPHETKLVEQNNRKEK